MDEIVIRSMLKWPDVPSVYGWLALDRRGDWRIKTAGGRFDRVTNRAVIAFIGRNYGADAEGRWYFQNGPQRVFVALDYTPWIYRLDESGGGVATHTGKAPQDLLGAWIDESGALLLQSELGVGAVSDRDLPALIERIQNETGRSAEALLEAAAGRDGAECIMFGHRLRVGCIRSDQVPGRFGFIARPAPRPGEREC